MILEKPNSRVLVGELKGGKTAVFYRCREVILQIHGCTWDCDDEPTKGEAPPKTPKRRKGLVVKILYQSCKRKKTGNDSK